MGRGEGEQQAAGAAKRKWTIEEIEAKVESEGLGYAVTDYLNPEAVEDPELAALWEKAAEAMREVEAYLEKAAAGAKAKGGGGKAKGNLLVSHESILCDEVPKIFERVTKFDDYGLRQIDAKGGGTARLTTEGGRFGSDPEVFIDGEFEEAELEQLIADLEPYVAKHIPQSVSARYANGEYRSLRF